MEKSKWRKRIGAAALTCALLAGCGERKNELEVRSGMPEEYGAQIEMLCRQFVQEKQPVGLAVGILNNGAVSYWNAGAAEHGGGAVSEHTRFEIASVTKTFTSLLLALDVTDEDLGVSLEDPADRYLPFSLPERDGQPVELLHLATHSSGLPRMPSNYRESLNPYADYDMDKLLAYFETASLQSAPGTEYLYSNLGMGVLGVALTEIAQTPYDGGRGYERLLRENILDPLGMAETGIFLTEEELAQMAQPHTALGTTYPVWEFDALAACGALKSTTHDLTRYMAAAMGQLPCADALPAAFEEACSLHFTGDGAKIGLGFMLDKLPTGQTYCWHDGSSGGSRAALLFCRETGKGAVVLCNSAIPVYDLGVSLLAAMHGE